MVSPLVNISDWIKNHELGEKCILLPNAVLDEESRWILRQLIKGNVDISDVDQDHSLYHNVRENLAVSGLELWFKNVIRSSWDHRCNDGDSIQLVAFSLSYVNPDNDNRPTSWSDAWDRFDICELAEVLMWLNLYVFLNIPLEEEDLKLRFGGHDEVLDAIRSVTRLIEKRLG